MPQENYRVVLNFNVATKGTENVNKMAVAVDNYGSSKTRVIQKEQAHQQAMKNSIVVTDTYNVSTQSMVRTMHHLNMAALGINMSLLGLSWNLQRTGLFSDKMVEKITRIIAPMQMVMSIVNLSSAVWQGYIALQQLNTIQYAAIGARVTAINNMMSFSFFGLSISIFAVMAALAGVAAIFGAFISKSLIVRGILGVLGGAMIGYAIATTVATAAQTFFNGQLGPVGWAIIVGGLAIAIGAIAVLVGYIQGVRLWKGGIVQSPTTVTLGEFGPEAVVPLYSAQSRKMLGGAGGGGGITFNNTKMYLAPARPSAFSRHIYSAARREAYMA